MKNKAVIGILISCFLLMGCGEEKQAKIDAMASNKFYRRLQYVNVSEQGRLGSYQELASIAKSMGDDFAKYFPPKYNDYFDFEINSTEFTILSKVNISGCPDSTIWRMKCSVVNRDVRCITDGENAGIYNIRNLKLKVPAECEQVFPGFRNIGKK